MVLYESPSLEVVICFISAIAAIVAIIVAHKNNKRQMQISMFAEFTRRYQEIMLHIRKGEDTKYYQALYIDLCSEEFFIHNAGYLPKGVWKIWREGMTHEINDAYIDIWQDDKNNYNDDFQIFFNDIVANYSK